MVARRPEWRGFVSPLATQTVARINAAIASTGGRTNHGQTGREKSNGSRNAKFSIAPQPTESPAANPRNASGSPRGSLLAGVLASGFLAVLVLDILATATRGLSDIYGSFVVMSHVLLPFQLSDSPT